MGRSSLLLLMILFQAKSIHGAFEPTSTFGAQRRCGVRIAETALRNIARFAAVLQTMPRKKRERAKGTEP